jgi:hypothetical protein
MNESEKFQLEFVTTDELCLLARNLKIEIEKLQRDMRLFGKEDDSYPQWRNELWTKQRRYRYIIKRIQSRQMKMF